MAEYEKRFQKLPSLYGFSHYSGAMWVGEALKAIGGRAEDRDALHSKGLLHYDGRPKPAFREAQRLFGRTPVYRR